MKVNPKGNRPADERVAVFVCECGPNIKEAVDIGELLRFAESLPHVFLAKPHGLLCSPAGKRFLIAEIEKHGVTRVVVAGCSPKEHEFTFRGVMADAGLNPYLLQMANIREQCAWVTEDKAVATEKAKALLGAAVHRVVHHEPLEERQLAAEPDVAVVGAGVAGMSAALTLAQHNRRVYVIEKAPFIGGKAIRYEDIFPHLECASCVLEPMLDAVLHHENIHVLTCSDVEEVRGYYGNFTVRVKQRASYVDPDACVGCGACMDACPVHTTNDYNEGMDERHAIYIPFDGALPNVARIDREHCLHWQSEGCRACEEACEFQAVHFEAKDEVREIKAGAVVVATGFDLFDPRRAPQYGYGESTDVYTSLEFETMIHSSGPTQGKIRLKNGSPPSTIAFVHCVGSRTKRYHEHCSGVCCAYSLHFSLQAINQIPEVSVVHLYSDWCLPGKKLQGLHGRAAAQQGVGFRRMETPDSIEIGQEKGRSILRYRDPSGTLCTLPADMVVLAPAMVGARSSRPLGGLLDLAQDGEGFFVEEDVMVAPVSTTIQGVFLAGCASGPKDIARSVAEGQAAAGRILSRLIPGENITPEPATAVTDEGACSGCRVCVGLCPYHAIDYDEKKGKASINEILCRGCGVCSASCPSGAIAARHFTDREISEEIKGLVNGKPLDRAEDGLV